MKKILCLSLCCALISSNILGQKYTSLKTASKKLVNAYNDATKLLMQDNQDEATHLLEQLTSSEPKFIDAWLLLGELYNEQKDFVKGRDALEKVVSLDSDYASKTWIFK